MKRPDQDPSLGHTVAAIGALAVVVAVALGFAAIAVKAGCDSAGLLHQISCPGDK